MQSAHQGIFRPMSIDRGVESVLENGPCIGRNLVTLRYLICQRMPPVRMTELTTPFSILNALDQVQL